MAARLSEVAPESNPFPRAPFCVTVYSCTEQRPVKSYYFLGDAPKAVRAAARRGRLASRLFNAQAPFAWPNTKWTTADESTLRTYYGKSWRSALVPNLRLLRPSDSHDEAVPSRCALDAKPDEPEVEFVRGGDESTFDFGDLNTLNRMDEDGAVIITEGDLEAAAKPGAKPFAARDEDPTLPFADAVRPGDSPATEYLDYSVFPEDTLADLGEKIFVATGVPPFRQHLFWGEDEAASTFVQQPYLITSTGVAYQVDAREFGQGEGLHIADVPIDRTLAGLVERGEIFVEAGDSFRLISEVQCGTYSKSPLHHIYLCDLEEVVAPHRRALAAATQDRLRADLLYRGLILKYWPKLNIEAMTVYLNSEKGLRELFPDLVPSRPALESRYAKQRQLLSQMYLHQEPVYRRNALPRSLAVTSATIMIESGLGAKAKGAGKLRVNIRSVLDMFATSTVWPAIAARFFLAAAGRGRQDITVTKTHISAALGGNDDSCEIQRVLARTLRRSSIVIIIRPRGKMKLEVSGEEGLVDGAWLKGRAQLVHFTLFDNGAYQLEASWPEDQRLPPDEIIRSLGTMIRPLIQSINEMGTLVFPTGGELSLPEGGQGGNVQIRGMNVSAYWPRVLSEGAFRQLKGKWREYETAGLVSVRGLQQAGAFAFQMLKGVVDYDPRAIERTIVVSTVTDNAGHSQTVREITERTQNTYSYLVDPVVSQRWACLYGGRTTRFHHRTSDVKIEMVGISGDELRRIWRILFTFLDGLVHGPNKIAGLLDSTRTKASGTTGNSLRALQDSDPELYDLRKFDAKATVYSVLCQNPRPPVAYTPDEVDKMSARRRGELVSYWNFTEDRPAYYECANRKFPHLSFLEGRHPKGYCLPCCQKTVAFPGSRRDRINSQCLTLYGPDASNAGAEVDPGEGSSRHVLSYGKRIAPGRIATLSRFLEDELLFQTLEAGTWHYRLFGVPQQLSAIPSAGFFFALAEVLEQPPTKMAETFAWATENMGESFATLAGGRAGATFQTAAALSAGLRATFAGQATESESMFTPFSPGGEAHEFWEELLEELAGICYGAYIIVFEDPDGSSHSIRASARAPVRDRMQTTDQDPVGVIFKIGQPEGKRGGGGTYPLIIQGAPVSPGGPKQNLSLFTLDSSDPGQGLVEVLRELVLSTVNSSGTEWNLRALACFLVQKCATHYRCAWKLIGRRDLCYGVILQTDAPAQEVYVPVVSSYHSHTDAISTLFPGAKTHYGPRSTVKLSEEPCATTSVGQDADAVTTFLALLLSNQCYRDLHKRKGGCSLTTAPFRALQAYLTHQKQYVGVAVQFGGNVLNFYHAPQANPLETSGFSPGDHGPPTLDLPALPCQIDAAIWESNKEVSSRTFTPAASREAYLSVLYRLFLSEFASLIYRRRNATTRKALIAAVESTKTHPKTILGQLRIVLKKVSAGDACLQADLEKLQEILVAGRGRKSGWFKCMLGEHSFEFDRAELYSLRRGNVKDVKKRVKALMEERVELMPLARVVSEGFAAAILNHGVYTSCFDWPKGTPSPCDARTGPGKLVVAADRFDALVDILVAELQNPLKWGVFIFQTSGVLDDLDFIRRPGEKLEVRF
jgi:hypothetical protein